MLNNQARVLESRTTRTGIPHGPGGAVLPPKVYFDNLPEDLEIDGPGQRTARGSVATQASSNSGAEPGLHHPKQPETKRAVGEPKAELSGGGHANAMEKRGEGGPKLA